MSEHDELFYLINDPDLEIIDDEPEWEIRYYHFGNDIKKHITTTTTVFLCGETARFNESKSMLDTLWDNGKGAIEEFLRFVRENRLEVVVHEWKDFPAELTEDERMYIYDDEIQARWYWRGLYYLGCDALETKDSDVLNFVIDGLGIIGCGYLHEVFSRLREDINKCDDDGNTSLIFAAMHGSYIMAKALVAAGANLDLRNPRGQTALMCAIEKEQGKIASLLVENGADINLQDNEGKTALMYAVEGNNRNFVRTLINAKVKINMHDENGKTALMYAVEAGQYNVVKLLLDGDADPNLGIIGNHWREGVLPINVARNNNDNEMIELLLRATERWCGISAMPGHGRPRRQRRRVRGILVVGL